jgi:glyoxylase-like metal-dependent hydrolase (beta-lactamase superfamily II)
MSLTRRQTLIAGAALPFAGTALTPLAAFAQETAAPAAPLPFRTFTVGDFKVTSLLAASFPGDNPQALFGLNVSAEEFAAVSAANFIPADRTQSYFTPTLVDTGAERILFDTGLDPQGVTVALAASGYQPGDITHVVITHMHPDHIGGLADDAGIPTFANAVYVTGQVEFDFWAAQGNEGFEAKVRPLADRMSFIGDGGAVRSGITGVAAFGHSAGHMTYMLESGGTQMLLLADSANHHVWSLAYPDWEFAYDADKAAAAATRRTLLGMAAADRFAVMGYHLPFPAAGFIETRGDGFHFVPVTYQMM